jgi:serine/threonine protein kinase
VGPYEITGFLGAGGMGEVYRAHDTNLNRVVALKLLPADLATDPDRLRRFEQEARTAGALSHPSVVTIYDAGQIGSQPFISMELVGGETLREILGTGALPMRRGLKVAGQVSEGLAAAHEAGLVHRDLKPENIKVSIDGFAKILDFGLAKRVPPRARGGLSFEAMTETSPGMVVGTPAYMSPEQASGGLAEFSSDQFSFGAILYEMLTGRRAFERPTIAETLSAVIREEPPAIAQLNPAVPPPVRWIVERCLAKAPEERYALTRDLARDLASAREHLTELLASRRVRPAKPASGKATVAVLPVLNLLNDPRHDAMADAMTDALITALTRFNGLRVVSRAASMAYKGRRSSVPDVADELGVDWIVLSSIAKAAGELRISAQLVDASNDENQWAGSYNRRGRNVLSLQADVAEVIAREVGTALAQQDGATPTRP